MKKLVAIISLVSSISFAQQNLKDNYTPLKSSGTLPDIFTQNIRNVIKTDITDLNKQRDNDKALKSNYLTEANYEIERIVKSGNTLINDEVTIYLNKVADVILKSNPALRNQLHIYTLKSSVVNAYSYDKGYIFIDIGLISQAETEAQLAYILCHEISHYTKKHNINGYIKNKKIDNQNYSGKSKEDRLIEKCQYSKESESEADIEGFRLFEQTNYNFKQAEKAFDVLQYAHLPFELVEFKKTFFETDHFKIPTSYLLKEVSSIRNNSNEDDTKHTHPNTAKRKQAIMALIANRSNKEKVDAIVGQSEFEYIRDLSRMELCRLYLKRRDYPNALYAAYIMANKYPNNQYVAEVISKCMYAISLYGKGTLRYNSDSYLEDGFPTHTDIESYPQQLYHLINKMPANEWTIMSLNYVFRIHKRYPQNEKIGSYSDSLFRLMKQVNWGVVDFVKTNKKEEVKVAEVVDTTVIKAVSTSKTDLIATLQKENNFKNYDTAYYKEVFVDLFMNDTEFVSKFPSAGENTDVSSSGGFSDYRAKKSTPKNDNAKLKKVTLDIEKVVLYEPFYLKIDETLTEEVRYMDSDERQEKYIVTVNECANKQNLQIVTLDPNVISANEVDKINDYSVINDWFSEKFDANDDDKNPIFNTDEMAKIITKYGTQYVLKTGIVNYKSKRGRKTTYFYAFVYDLNKNEIVYRKQEEFRGKDSKDLVNAKVYQMIYELKHPKK